MQEQSFRAMGCQMLALLDADGFIQAAHALAQLPGWFEAWEQQLSRFRVDSELVQLNQANGQPMHVSQILWDVLDLALAGAQQSAGLVTPTLLGALESAGYDRSWDERLPHDWPHNVGLPTTGAEQPPEQPWHQIERDPHTATVRLPTGMQLDFGGVAKGWAAHKAVERLRSYGPTLIDAGGDIALSGPTASGEPWLIDVADPFAPEHDLVTLLVRSGGVATSGRDYRRWQRSGQELHHIINPRTNQPAQTDVLSATVIAPTAYEAEIAAKAALILGSAAGCTWLDQRPAYAGLLVLANRHVLHTQRLRGFIAA